MLCQGRRKSIPWPQQRFLASGKGYFLAQLEPQNRAWAGKNSVDATERCSVLYPSPISRALARLSCRNAAFSLGEAVFAWDEGAAKLGVSVLSPEAPLPAEDWEMGL